MSYLINPTLSSLGFGTKKEYALSFSYEFTDEDLQDGSFTVPGIVDAVQGALLTLNPAAYTNNLSIPTFLSMQFSMTFNQRIVGDTPDVSWALDGDYILYNPTTGQQLRFGQPNTGIVYPLGDTGNAIVSGLVPFILNSNSTMNIYKLLSDNPGGDANTVFTSTLFTIPLGSYITSGFVQGDQT